MAFGRLGVGHFFQTLLSDTSSRQFFHTLHETLETPIETKTDKFRRQASGGVKSDHDTFTLAELKRARGWKAEPGWERA